MDTLYTAQSSASILKPGACIQVRAPVYFGMRTATWKAINVVTKTEILCSSRANLLLALAQEESGVFKVYYKGKYLEMIRTSD